MPESSRKEASRRRILDAGREVFFEQGFEKANLDEVARRAGIAKGTIYRYFDSKAELYVEVLLVNADVFDERLLATIDTTLTPEQQIRRLATFYFNHYSTHRDYFQIFWAVENQRLIGDLPPALVQAVTQVWTRSLRVLTGLIEQGIEQGDFHPCDAWEMANILWTTANALIRTNEVTERRELWERDIAKVYEDAIDFLVGGLLRRSGPAESR
ncbi:MAG: TetR/AcrR family transcriptional regulator [bacterium]|nr:TetR/AcrR family transcriptional regulator [bacterium]